METTNVAPMLQPNTEQIRQHLHHLFGGLDQTYHDAKIELAWTDGRDGRLRHAESFTVDELDRIADRAVEINCAPNQNVYIGQALRHPHTAPFGRGSDSDFYALTAFYIDIDDDVIAAASRIYRARGCSPTAVVFTGRNPHPRAQMLWRLETPIQDPDLCRRQNSALAQTLFGDPSVINPGRVLRLAGSIAWPRKDGRVLELTEFRENDLRRPNFYTAESIARAFPVAQPELASAPVQKTDQDNEASAPTPAKLAGDLNIGTSTLSVDACISRIHAGNHWHDNMLRLVGHWIGRGWSDAEIAAAAEAMTLPGYTAAQTRADVATMIVGGRSKWNVPNPSVVIEDKPASSVINLMDWTADRYSGEAQPITWLCSGAIPLGVPALVAAMGGLGKSYIALDLALNIAAGVAGLEQQPLILGGRIAVQGTAVVVTAEDSFDAVHRRLNKIDPEARRLRHPKRLIVLPMPDAGGTQPLVASDGKNFVRTPFFQEIKRQLGEIKDLRLVVIDPLQAFVSADVNADPAAAQFMWSAIAELAASTGTTVLLTHHMRKDGMMRISSGEDARESIRGTTALVDGARLAYALWKLDEDAATPVCEKLGVEFERGRIVCGAVVKSNDETDHSTHVYLRQESGLLRQVEVELESSKSKASNFKIEQAREVLKEVQRRFDEGNPFSPSPQSQARYLGAHLKRQYGLDRREATNLIADWLNNGILVNEVMDQRTKQKGLKVTSWL
jgi:RecA-family ATPase